MSAQNTQPAKPSSSPVAAPPPDQAEDRFGEEEGGYGDGQARHEDCADDTGKRDPARRDFHDEKSESGRPP